MLFIGSSDEKCGNALVQYNPSEKRVRIRLPDYFEKEFGKHLILENVEFPENLRDHFYYALGNGDLSHERKNQKTNLPISYRLVKRVNKNTKEKAYYLQASFAVTANEIKTNKLYGAIAVDINDDHLAVAEIDHYGNYIYSTQIPLSLAGKTTDQRDAILGDAVAIVVKMAANKGKPIVIENLDFTKKKNRLRDVRSKKYRKKLSSFAYSLFHKKTKSCCNKHSVEFIGIGPEFSSLLGFYKYQGLNVSTHEKAAIVLARRGLKFKESCRIFKSTRSSPVTELTPLDDGRHAWKFLSQHKKTIRDLIIKSNGIKVFNEDRKLYEGHPSLSSSLGTQENSTRVEGLKPPDRRTNHHLNLKP